MKKPHRYPVGTIFKNPGGVWRIVGYAGYTPLRQPLYVWQVWFPSEERWAEHSTGMLTNPSCREISKLEAVVLGVGYFPEE